MCHDDGAIKNKKIGLQQEYLEQGKRCLEQGKMEGALDKAWDTRNVP